MFAYLNEPGVEGIGIAFTDRLGGASRGQFTSFNLGHTDEDELSALRTNMHRLRERLGIGPVCVVKQVHGTTIRTIDAGAALAASEDAWLGDRVEGLAPLARADAQVSTSGAVALAVRVADCVPVLLADEATHAIAAVHAGRVGLLSGVLQAAVGAMRAHGARTLVAWVGPHICGRCYEVPAAMQEQACAVIPALRATTSWGTPSLDLGAGAQDVLEREAVQVHRLDPCTRTDARFFSHRGDHGRTGNQIGLIWRVAGHVGPAAAG
ncbi:conserved hypothetical protein [Propionibacterium cyclohexanicum]|uniref:Purine nucleoside phosphorylase n=1 Tax=Propionibacterium cyclohexanicum TaxID=64702 RepID=A0A1H9PJP5_9ACTN|nr:polyphenol oxidase family protein [Propionibacterium cyclohexanicum]SER48408.1 conserved hypothetical protein [Propionibacterium cyclohexanicum]